MLVLSQKRDFFNVDFSQGNREKSAGARSGEHGGYSNVVTLFCDKKYKTKPDWYARVVFWPFSFHCIPKSTKMSVYKNYPHVTITLNYTGGFRKFFEIIECMDSRWKF
jgi:hypothetical protein